MKKNKLFFICIFIILIIILLMLSFYILQTLKIRSNFENTTLDFASKNEESIFFINKILLFSSADAKNKYFTASTYTVENLYQYTDMAIFLSSNSEDKTLENTLKSVTIKNINFSKTPSIGDFNLYYKNINNFSKGELNEENIIEDSLDFVVTAEDSANLDIPTLYNNLANPIILSYINSNLKDNYTIPNTKDPITYDGSLLKRCNVDSDNLSCTLSFNISIVNNLNQEFATTVSINIPLESTDNSIYDGKIYVENNVNYTFYRYK